MAELNSLSGRMVVTGHSPDGRARIVADRIDRPRLLADGGVAGTFFWGRDEIAAFPDDGRQAELLSALPLPGGCRFSTLTIPPGSNGPYHRFIVDALGELADANEPGFHATSTLDFIVVLTGTLELELDDGVRTLLTAGDTAVLNGVRHRWSNAGQGAATLFAAQVGAQTG